MIATGGPCARTKISEMLVNIEDILGWRALERLLYGGKKSALADLQISFTNLRLFSYSEGR
jgi:hypothetical protein